MKISRDVWKEFNEAAMNHMFTTDTRGLIKNRKIYTITNGMYGMSR